MKNVVFVYLGNTCNRTLYYYYWIAGYELAQLNKLTENELKSIEYQYKKWAVDHNAIKYGDNFKKEIIPDTYYFFITTNAQELLFNEHLELQDLKKYLVWESREYAENQNYPGTARLKAHLLYIPKDFKQ